MRQLFAIAHETWILLRRDRIFVPFILMVILVTTIANLASDWAIEDFTKILFDFGAAGFHITGGLVAIMWGTKTLIDSRSQGAVETQLATPVSRATWLVGKYLGLASMLVALALVFIAVWQSVMAINKFGIMGKPELIMFGFLVVDWLIVAAMAVMFAALMSSAVALFSCAMLWVVGLSAPSIQLVMAPDADPTAKVIVGGLAKYWNLQQFVLSDYLNSPGVFPTAHDLEMRLLYAGCLIGIMLTAGAVGFSRRDLGS